MWSRLDKHQCLIQSLLLAGMQHEGCPSCAPQEDWHLVPLPTKQSHATYSITSKYASHSLQHQILLRTMHLCGPCTYDHGLQLTRSTHMAHGERCCTFHLACWCWSLCCMAVAARWTSMSSRLYMAGQQYDICAKTV